MSQSCSHVMSPCPGPQAFTPAELVYCSPRSMIAGSHDNILNWEDEKYKMTRVNFSTTPLSNLIQLVKPFPVTAEELTDFDKAFSVHVRAGIAAYKLEHFKATQEAVNKARSYTQKVAACAACGVSAVHASRTFGVSGEQYWRRTREAEEAEEAQG